MIHKMTIILSTIMLVGAKSDDGNCKPGHISYISPTSEIFCDVLSSQVAYQTWYQAGAILKVIDGVFTVELVSNNHEPSSLNADGKGIVRLEKDFAIISSLERLSIEDNSITSIYGSSVFKGLPQLVYLSLARNRITYLSEDTFQGLNKLAVLNLNHNNLQSEISFSIDRSTLPALKQLYLQNNQLDQITVQSGTSVQLCDSNLEHLYLSSNSIRSFHIYDVNYDDYTEPMCLMRLTHLFLEDNYLEGLGIPEFVPLEALSLDGNNFREIPQIPSQLKFLSLARNRITHIPYLPNAEAIEFLILSYNTITELSGYENLRHLSTLQHLALDYNFPEPIPGGFFQNLTSLRSLYLTRNKMSKISPQAFTDLPRLQEISILTN